MPIWTRNILIVLMVLCAGPVFAQNKDEAKPQPRVLIIGDSIYRQHARGVGNELKGKARVSLADYPYEWVINSTTVIEQLDRLLGRVDRNGEPVPEEKWPRWDVIHFNVGLGDLIHRMPDMESFRVLPIHAGGVVATTPEQYEKNLGKLVGMLREKSPDAKLIWASTTPIRASRSNLFRLGSEIEYNRIAEKVMKRHRVTVNDMYAYARSIMDMDKPAGHGADPFNFDKKPIDPPIVEAISKVLGLPMPRKDEESVASKG